MTAATTRELILQIALEHPSITVDELIRQLRLRGIEVRLKTVANTLTELAKSGELTRVSTGHYVIGSAFLTDLDKVTAAIGALIEENGGTLPKRSEKQSAALALVDSCFSLRVRYAAVRRVLRRVERTMGLQDTEAFSISVLLRALDVVVAEAGGIDHADEALVAWFGNAGVSPGGTNSKGRTVYLLARRLLEMGYDDRASFQRLGEGSLDERAKRCAEFDVLASYVVGVGLATTSYLLVQLGIDRVKPDIWVRRFVWRAIGDNTRPLPSAALTAELLEKAVARVRQTGTDCKVGDVDQVIWVKESSRRISVSALPRRTGQRSSNELKEGDLVDWRPQDRLRTSERFHGIVLASLDEEMVRVLWTESDTTRRLNLEKSGPLSLPYEQTISTDDLVSCDSRGPRHPRRRPACTVEIGTTIDWSPGRKVRERWHGVVVGFVDGNSHKVIVRWTASDSHRKLTFDGTHPLLSPHYSVELISKLAPCVPGTLHPEVNNLTAR